MASSRRTASTGTRPYPREGPRPSASTSGPASSTRAYISNSEDSPFGIPQVAADGSPSGLSADGKTLVLIRSFGPINRASLVVLGTNRLHVKNRIELKGQYSFDAIAPDGRHAYVVEYPDPFRYDRYRVLKLDLKTGHLAKHPITDEDVGLDEEEEEAGRRRGRDARTALSRVSSEDGRWAYTLYDGGGDVPFIHALDTVGDKAVCVFMPQLEELEHKQIAQGLDHDRSRAGNDLGGRPRERGELGAGPGEHF